MAAVHIQSDPVSQTDSVQVLVVPWDMLTSPAFEVRTASVGDLSGLVVVILDMSEMEHSSLVVMMDILMTPA
jgi:hypothetical protein